MKRFSYLLFILFFLSFLVSCLPILLSSTLGIKLICQITSRHLDGDLSIEKLNLSWLGPQTAQGIELKNKNFEAKATSFTSSLPFWNILNLDRSFKISQAEIAFPFYKSSLKEVFITRNDEQLKAIGLTSEGGSFSLEGSLSSQAFSGVFKGEKLPGALLDTVLNGDGIIQAALGNQFKINASFDSKDKAKLVKVELDSNQIELSLNAHLQNSKITLDDPLKIQFLFAPELSEKIFKRHPNDFMSAFWSLTAGSMSMSPSASIPYNPFELKKMQIKEGFLDLAKLEVVLGNKAQGLFALLKHSSQREKVSVWLNVCDFEIENGLLQYDRVDALIDEYFHICSWGRIDLSRELLDLFIGLPADTLKKAFNIENLPSAYVLKIPVKGSLKNPVIDVKAASAKIASMVAAQQIPKAIGGKSGKIFGSILNFATRPTEDEDVPVAKRPFPWEKGR